MSKQPRADGSFIKLTSTLQQWVDMYNKADKERFEALLQRDKYKNALDEIFEDIEYVEATAERIDDDNYIALACRIAETSRNILQLIKEAKERE